MSTSAFLRDNARYLSAGALLTFSSSFGQTYFIAIFAGNIMAAYGLSDGQWGALYTVATTASAIVMYWAGALTDVYRTRHITVVVFPALASVCVAMAFNTSIVLLCLIIFLLRFFGQGMMSQLAVTSMARWFASRRGLALSVTALGFSFGQATLPVILASLFPIFEWRDMWLLSAAVLLFTLPIVRRLLSAERAPRSLADDAPVAGMHGRHWTRAEMLRSPVFWLLLPMLLGPPSWGTALFFQQVHIASVKGWPLLDYLSLIPMLTAVTVATTLVSGQLIDRFGSARLVQMYLVPWIAGFLILAGAETLAMAAVAFVIFGVSMGLQATIITAFWAEFYGTRHIGAIKAASTSIMVFGSAIGPGVSGHFIDLGFDFPDQMAWVAAYFILALILVWIAVTRALTGLVPTQVDVERP